MALESQPISIANVENGVSPFVHRAWAWNSTGTDRFTLDYPNDNIILNSQFKTDLSGWLTGSATAELDTINTLDGLNTMKVGLGADDTAGTKRRVFYRYNGETGLVPSTGSIWLKADKNVQIGIRTDGGTKIANYNVTTEWQRFEIPQNGYMILLWAKSDCVLWIGKPKVEKATKATIYTPAPSEDFNNAYPTYEGVYSDTTVNGSTDPLKYTWTRMRGEDGVAGKDGRGITSTETTYAIHTSGTVAPTTGWTASVPTLVKGSYLWTRNIWTYTDNTKETGYSVTYIAKDGNNGIDGIAGKDGVGIKSTAFTYATSTNGTTAPTTGWTTTVPTVTAGNYLWTRVVWTYTDDTTETGYSVARWGANGTNGVSVTGIQVEYAQTTSSAEPSTGWSTTKPTPQVGNWFWTRTRNVLSNGTYTTWVVTVSFIGRDAVIVSDVAPANPIKGMLWQKTTDPTVLEWNGTAWVNWGISVNNIVADNVIAENGKFKRIDGVEIWSATFGSQYISDSGDERPDIGNYALQNKGTMTINDGIMMTRYDTFRKDTGAFVGNGRTYYNEKGISFFNWRYSNPNDLTDPTHYWGFSYNADGITGVDSRVSYFGARMDINDMLHERTYDNQIAPLSGFEPYGTVANGQYPLAERHGRLVELFGAFKTTKIIPASGARTIMNEPLPVWARPRSVVRRIQQGSGSNIFLLEIYPDGTISIARYGKTDYIDVPVGAWINIGCVYTGKDVVKSPFEHLPDD